MAADFTGADCTDADFTGADLSRANFTWAIGLRPEQWQCCQLFGTVDAKGNLQTNRENQTTR
ncbi:MAG: pentapeptide repeat-containing protein [Pseudanabaenaceae cyanobacterium]